MAAFLFQLSLLAVIGGLTGNIMFHLFEHQMRGTGYSYFRYLVILVSVLCLGFGVLEIEYSFENSWYAGVSQVIVALCSVAISFFLFGRSKSLW